MSFALGSSAAFAPTRVRVNRAPAGPSRRVRVPVRAHASSGSKNANEPPSRREVLAAPGLAALTAQLWLPGSASAKSPRPREGRRPFRDSGHQARLPWVRRLDDGSERVRSALGPLGGSVGCTDYAQFKPVIGFIDGIKSGECPPWAKDATRGFLLREEGGNRVMLDFDPRREAQKDGLSFFIDKSPKANPLWEESNKTWKDPASPIRLPPRRPSSSEVRRRRA